MLEIDWDKINEHVVTDGVHGKFIHTNNMTLVLWRFDKGADLPLHSHLHEQLTLVRKGEFHLMIGEENHVLLPGSIFSIPSNIPHGGKAVKETIALDIFSPIREDFVEKFD